MRVDVVTLFPEVVTGWAGIGVVGRAQERGLLAVHAWNPRDYATDAYRRVDERVFGGGPGMVMLIDPLRAALNAARAASAEPAKVIYLSPQGTRLDQAKVAEFARRDRLILLSGRERRFVAPLLAGTHLLNAPSAIPAHPFINELPAASHRLGNLLAGLFNTLV